MKKILVYLTLCLIVVSSCTKPSVEPIDRPTDEPTEEPTDKPEDVPSNQPNDDPNDTPTDAPTDNPAEDSSHHDLSASETANSYIVSNAGTYKFKAVKGNSSDSIGNLHSAEVMWESFGNNTAPSAGDLVKSVECSGNYIVFQTADDFLEGNALIAAKDADGNILWSWHIWLTDQPEVHKYFNDSGSMMDRNLGATSTTPGDICSLGLLYQWGRKDPFLGSNKISLSSQAKSTITWPTKVSVNEVTGTIEYSIANPTTYISFNSTNSDWLYDTSQQYAQKRWTTSDKPKSIYDPCPQGWRVPDGGENNVWSNVAKSTSFTYSYDSTNKGMDFSNHFGANPSIWYPTPGYRYGHGGTTTDVGRVGYYWTASLTKDEGFAYYMQINASIGQVDIVSDKYNAYGRSVRCIKVEL